MMNKMKSLPDDLGLVDFRDEWLQDLLWDKQSPQDFYQTDRYNKTDMMKHLEILHSQSMVFFWGSKELGLVLRVHVPNKYVLEPHLLGAVHRWRTLQPVAMDFAFNHIGCKKINVYTPYSSIKGVMLRYGFNLEGVLANSVLLRDGSLTTKYILGLTKEQYELYSKHPAG